MGTTVPVTPCASCPWRRSTPTDGSTIPGYDFTLVEEDLSRTAGTNGEDGWFSIMACHQSANGDDSPCRGYLAVEGLNNLHVRLLTLEGQLPLGEIQETAAGLDLYRSFQAMRDALAEGAQV